MSNIGSYYMELTEQASVLTLREFTDKYGDTFENHNVWFEVNDESDHEELNVQSVVLRDVYATQR